MQFFFKRIEKYTEASDPEGKNSKLVEKTFTDSFNTEMVITTTEIEEGKRVVTLNDGHIESRYGQYPVIKAGKHTGNELRKEAAYFQSQIVLEADDAERFISLLK